MNKADPAVLISSMLTDATRSGHPSHIEKINARPASHTSSYPPHPPRSPTMASSWKKSENSSGAHLHPLTCPLPQPRHRPIIPLSHSNNNAGPAITQFFRVFRAFRSPCLRGLFFKRLSYIYIMETRAAFPMPRDPRQPTARSTTDPMKGSCASTTTTLPTPSESHAFSCARHAFPRA